MGIKNMELNADSLKDLSKLPQPAKLVLSLLVAAIVIGAAYFIVFSKQLTTLEEIVTQEGELRTNYEISVKKVAGLKILEKQIAELNESFAGLLKQLPTTSDTSSVVKEIHQAAATNSVITYMFTPGAPFVDGQIEATPYSIEIRGGYDNILKFMSDVGQLSRLITVENISLKPIGNNQFTLNATAKVYRSLEPAKTEQGKGDKK